MHSLLKSAKTAGTVTATGSLFLVGTCSSNPEPPSAPTAPLATPSEGSSGIIGNTAGFMGTSTLSKLIQNLTPAAVKDAVSNCVESDDSKPIIFGSKSVHGFIYVMAVGNDGTTVLSTAKDPAIVSRINEKAESAENYMPYELPDKHAFSGISRGSPFVVVINEDNRIYQEFVFANTDADVTQPLIDEVIQDSQQP